MKRLSNLKESVSGFHISDDLDVDFAILLLKCLRKVSFFFYFRMSSDFILFCLDIFDYISFIQIDSSVTELIQYCICWLLVFIGSSTPLSDACKKNCQTGRNIICGADNIIVSPNVPHNFQFPFSFQDILFVEIYVCLFRFNVAFKHLWSY